MVRGALSDNPMIQLKVVTGTWNSQKYQDQILGLDVRSPLDSLDGQNIVLREEIARPLYSHHRGIQKSTEHRLSSVARLEPYRTRVDKLGWCVWNREPALSKPLLILLDSTAWVGQDFMSWTHVPSEFKDENVPSCFSTVWRLYTILTGSNGLLWTISWLFAPDPESVCSKEKVLKKLQLLRPYCKSFADSLASMLLSLNFVKKNMGNFCKVFAAYRQDRDSTAFLYHIAGILLLLSTTINFGISRKFPFLPFQIPKWCFQMEFA